MEKSKKSRNCKGLRLHIESWKKKKFFHGEVGRKTFPQQIHRESTKSVEKNQRWELMLVLMAFTFSANALSVFIFFSTCWME